MTTTGLQQQEAVLLAHALVARLAADVGARILFIKGPSAVAVGARPDRPSSDVDVLVEPWAFEALCGVLDRTEWVRREFTLNTLEQVHDLTFNHSAHYIHPEWPCDLDVHFSFPGFFAEPNVVFGALWDRRQSVRLAGVDLPTPDLLGQALVVGLHALRDPHKASSTEDLRHLEAVLRRDLDQSGREELKLLSDATGALESAEPLLNRVGVDVDAPEMPSAGAAAWRVRQQFGDISGWLWLTELQRAPLRSKARVLHRLLVPPRELLLPSHLANEASRTLVVRLHVRRWRRAVRALPGAVRVVRNIDRQRQ